MLRDGYSLPFRERPHLSRFPLIVSKYSNPLKQGSFGSFDLSNTKESRQKSGCPVFSRILQPSFSGSKTEQKMVANLGPKQTQSFPNHQHIQDGNGDHQAVSSKRGMGHVIGFQRCVFPHSYSPEIQEVPKVLPEQGQFPVHIPSFWFGNGSVGIHQSGQGSQADGSSKGYQDPPVPRQLVVESPLPGNLPTSYPDPIGPLPRVGLGSKHEEVGIDPSAGFQFRRLPVRPVDRSGFAHSGPVVYSETKVKVHPGPEQLHSQTVHVTDRSAHGNGETGLVGSPSYEAHPVALEATLARSGGSRKGHSIAPVSSSSPRLVVGREQCTAGSASASSAARSAVVYRCLKRRLGCSLRGLHCQRHLVRTRKLPPLGST